MGLTISKEQITELPIETFSGKIVVADNENDIEKAIAYLSTQTEIGFDTETKPAFRKGQNNKVALMQLSSMDTCFLFRLNKIGYPDALDDILCNAEIKKIGLSLKDDFAAIRKRTDKKPVNFIDLQLTVLWRPPIPKLA